jgi:hypothetical protein
MTTIKITELSDIGANLTTSTLVPVVNMAGVPVTQKTNVGNIANLILEGAGVDYPEASVALLAQTVSNAAQPNITSVGTLTNITVSGNASINGNITSNGTAYVGNLSTTGLASITTLNVGTTANLGSVNNVIIEGGTDGQVLTTDGDGNLSWTSGATSYGDSNVVTLLSAFGSNTITTTGNVSIGNITANNLGNVSAINKDGSNSNVLYGNGVFAPVTGGNSSYGDSNVVSLMAAFGSNTITTTGNISGGNLVTGGQVVASGNVSSGTGLSTGGFLSVDGTADLHDTSVTGNLAATGNITATNLGNISAINLTGSNSNVLYGNGVFAAVTVGNLSTGTNANTIGAQYLKGDGSNISNIAGANVSGFVPNANVANTAFAVAAANVSGLGNIATVNLDGNVSNLLTGNGTYVAIPTVPTVGNIATINLDGNSQTWLAGNGVFANIAIPSVGNIATINLTGSNSNVLYGNGTFAAVPAPTVSQDITSNGAMSIMTYDGNLKYVNYATVEPSSGNIAGGNISANGNISGGNISATGNITANNLGNISSINIDGSNSNVLYGNGVFAAVAGGNANTGNVTFDDNIVIGTGDEFGGDGLFLAPGNGSIANSAVQYLRVRGGDYPTHIHLDTGNNQYYDQYFGADGRYVKLEANGNVVINADDYLGNSATWTLTTDGNLILAGGNSVIQSIANSSL